MEKLILLVMVITLARYESESSMQVLYYRNTGEKNDMFLYDGGQAKI